jgi:S1-C subfamily serine protease
VRQRNRILDRLRHLQIAACILLTCASAIPCPAAEGFFTDGAPPAVRAVWSSVYAFVCESRTSSYTATAFLLKKQIRGQHADYYFMTAGHAIDDCKQPRRYLTENINQQRFESDGITLALPPPRLEPVERVYLDDTYDVAIAKVEAAASLRIGEPLTVGDKCDRALHREIYAVGFPGVGKRPSLGLKREEKRWSKGDYVGLGRAEFRRTTSIYIASTVDSLPGNSGGPVVDGEGALIGVLVQGVAGPDNGFRYDVDPKKLDDWQSFLVPCQAVLRIMERGGLK